MSEIVQKKNQEPKEVFNEYRNDIILFLDKHEEIFRSSYGLESDNVKNVAKFHSVVRTYKAQLQEKLNAYSNKLAEFQTFCNNLKKE